MTEGAFCDHHFDGLGTECRRCGSWKRGKIAPPCPPYVTRIEPDFTRLSHIKTRDENTKAWITWREYEEEQHPYPAINDGEKASDEKP